MLLSNTGSIALRLDDVQPPNTAATQSLLMSSRPSRRDRRFRRAVLTDDLDLLAEHAASRVDLLDGELDGVADGDLGGSPLVPDSEFSEPTGGRSTGVDARRGGGAVGIT